MALANYSDLKAALVTWSDRSDIGDALRTDFVTLAEARIRRAFAMDDIRMREMETRADLTPTSGVCSLPEDFMAMKAVQAQATNKTRLEYKPEAWVFESYPAGDSGTAAYYSIEGSQLYMYPLTTSDIRIIYFAYPATITGGAEDTNWLLDKYPDVYLHAGLIELRLYEQNNEEIEREAGLLGAAFEGFKKMSYGSQQATSPSMGAVGAS